MSPDGWLALILSAESGQNAQLATAESRLAWRPVRGPAAANRGRSRSRLCRGQAANQKVIDPEVVVVEQGFGDLLGSTDAGQSSCPGHHRPRRDRSTNACPCGSPERQSVAARCEYDVDRLVTAGRDAFTRAQRPARALRPRRRAFPGSLFGARDDRAQRHAEARFAPVARSRPGRARRVRESARASRPNRHRRRHGDPRRRWLRPRLHREDRQITRLYDAAGLGARCRSDRCDRTVARRSTPA